MERRGFGAGEKGGDGSWCLNGEASCFWEIEIVREGCEGGLGVAEAVEEEEDVDGRAFGWGGDVED